MKAIFVTGTDTGVGKTLIVGLLAKFLQDRGLRVVTQKWIQTGDQGFSSDIKVHLKLMGKLKSYLSLQSPYVFKLPASPHLAAGKEKKKISSAKIKSSFKALARKFDLVIVEGVGGSLVPFSKKKLVIDIARDLKLPVLIVAANKLGAINHTLLTIEALRRRKMPTIGLILNNISLKQNKTILKDNPRIIKSISQERILGILPYSKNKDLLYKKFVPIGKKIIEK
jgi:dethiobiotin synthetase